MRISKISKITNNIITVPTSPMLATQAMMDNFDIPRNQLRAVYRILFDDERMLNEPDGSHEIASNDCLIAIIEGGMKLFFIDRGDSGLPVFIVDGDDITECSLYEKHNFLLRPDKTQLIDAIKQLPIEDEV